jgi:hypothetical protein
VASSFEEHCMLKRVFVHAFAVLLIGYAFLGRGFAHLHLPAGVPLFVGEAVLGLGLLLAATRGRAFLRCFRMPAVRWYAVFFLLGVALTVPFLGAYGLTAVRDAALYYYGIFMVLVAGLAVTRQDVNAAVRLFGRVAPFFLLWAPVASYVTTFLNEQLPRAPGTEVSLVYVKPGDAAIHVGAILIFTMVMPRRSWLTRWPTAGMTLCVLAIAPTMYSRAAAMCLVFAVALVVALKPSRKLIRLGVILVLGLLLALATSLSVSVPDRERELSVEGVWEGFTSLFASGRSGAAKEYAGTKDWRVAWWETILDETLAGPYFLTGRGFGESLAVAHEIEGFEEEEGALPLRSPHNSHMTVLARMGVPGAVIWAVLNVLVVLALVRSRRRARVRGDAFLEGLSVVLLGYWLLFCMVGATDVLLEGPQGGIWFWSILGLAVALPRLEEPGKAQGIRSVP